MLVTRNRRIVAVLLSALAALPAVLAPMPTISRTAVENAPIVQVAVLPEAARPRRRRGYRSVRTIRMRLLRRMRLRGPAERPGPDHLRPWLLVRGSRARGPPG